MSGTLRFGLLPDEGGQYLLVQHMGVARAMDFLMRNRMVEADEALELGLVHEVVPASELDGAVAGAGRRSWRTGRRSRCASSSGRSTTRTR